MGGSDSRYSEYRTVNEAHEAVDIILRENPCLSHDAQNLLRKLRHEIYLGLDGESSARLSIYLGSENGDTPFKFKIGGGSQHLIVNILKQEITFRFSTGRYWTRFHRGAASLFKSIADRAAGALGGGGNPAISQ